MNFEQNCLGIPLGYSCNIPPGGPNTQPVERDRRISAMMEYVYHCLPGYNTTDPRTAQCMPNGEISLSSPPNCTGKCILV